MTGRLKEVCIIVALVVGLLLTRIAEAVYLVFKGPDGPDKYA